MKKYFPDSLIFITGIICGFYFDPGTLFVYLHTLIIPFGVLGFIFGIMWTNNSWRRGIILNLTFSLIIFIRQTVGGPIDLPYYIFVLQLILCSVIPGTISACLLGYVGVFSRKLFKIAYPKFRK